MEYHTLAVLLVYHFLRRKFHLQLVHNHIIYTVPFITVNQQTCMKQLKGQEILMMFLVLGIEIMQTKFMILLPI